ncbi:unnamed protein product [Chondrus crispus]|uniref:Uncharacterized protein n=1 Tax=Chondrus crispus TaxID=2769 RepID=R7QRT6_CHOCR|nr:unnamed protein product [Chondrus crispus]CDF40065.1 unnamed protein product [Chondrus crispus]|eukprot:XP_005710359.1 unnamed protein product [Chondrus crispus]
MGLLVQCVLVTVGPHSTAPWSQISDEAEEERKTWT